MLVFLNTSYLFCCRKLAGCTVFITGASRGIGKAIALKAAKDGANIVIAAKTTQSHPKLPGTIYTAAEESKCGTHPFKKCPHSGFNT
jgi:NAD(P)-dependent dehydrogenase (short-subunit alcohol dehydrogenase family)